MNILKPARRVHAPPPPVRMMRVLRHACGTIAAISTRNARLAYLESFQVHQSDKLAAMARIVSGIGAAEMHCWIIA